LLGKSDADLVRDALAGAKEPVAELLRRHWQTAVCLATRVLGSADLARDAAQEAAIAAMINLARLRCPDRFGAWFCGIALNVSRRWRRELKSEVSGLEIDLASAQPDPAETAEAADLSARVRAAVAGLAPGQRDAVWLFYLQGLSHREVAAELDISVGAVKARLHQARNALAPTLATLHEQKGTTMDVAAATHWVEVTVTGIRRSQEEDASQRKHVMMLKERSGDRILPIWIGPGSAAVMALALESVESPRPFSTNLAVGLVEAAGSQVVEVRITRLLDGVFYAMVVVAGPSGSREVDARPSDAVNLALVAGVPIRADEGLFAAPVPSDHAEELKSFPVATADIAAETQLRESNWIRP
jgi:RNA polymerase sigma factor (sigma-70 family)